MGGVKGGKENAKPPVKAVKNKENTEKSKPKENGNISINNKETPAKTPKGKKDTKKDTTTTTPTPKRNPEELRSFLLKSPNLPKKYEKFANFMKNNMKITDSTTQK